MHEMYNYTFKTYKSLCLLLFRFSLVFNFPHRVFHNTVEDCQRNVKFTTYPHWISRFFSAFFSDTKGDFFIFHFSGPSTATTKYKAILKHCYIADSQSKTTPSLSPLLFFNHTYYLYTFPRPCRRESSPCIYCRKT